MWRRAIPFLTVHLLPLGALFTEVTAADWILCGALYVVRMFFVTAAFHRYFSHKTFKLNRFFQFLFAFGAQTSAQRGALWWAAHHRHHHKYSDLPEDTHSPLQGFWWSHCTWMFSDENRRTKTELVKELARYPELRFLNRWHSLPAFVLAAAVFALGGPGALFIGFFLSTVLLWHGTFTINSLSHVFGTRRFVTRDTSRNNFLLALITLGEGWHNNHHHYPGATRQGFAWWEIDVTYYTLLALSKIGIVRDLRHPTAEALQTNRVADGICDIGMFHAHWSKATAALANRKARTGAFYEARRKALSELMYSTRSRAEDIATASKEHARRTATGSAPKRAAFS
jgi:stearoyl-CoA desaturase (delta-9 desaturase)